MVVLLAKKEKERYIVEKFLEVSVPVSLRVEKGKFVFQNVSS